MLEIIALALLFVVVRKIIAIRKAYQCVSDQVIRDYFDGRLKKRNKQMYEQAITHFGVCEKCQNKLESLVNEEPGQGEIESHLVE